MCGNGRRRDPVAFGLPLQGWDLAVVDADGRPVDPGEVGDLVSAGRAGPLPRKGQRRRESSAMPTLGWRRAYAAATCAAGSERTGLLRAEPMTKSRRGPSHRVGARSDAALRFTCRGSAAARPGTQEGTGTTRGCGPTSSAPTRSTISRGADQRSSVCLRR